MASTSFNNGKIASVEKQYTGGDGASRLRQRPATSHPAGPPRQQHAWVPSRLQLQKAILFLFSKKSFLFFFKVFQLFLSWIPKITTYLIPNVGELN